MKRQISCLQPNLDGDAGIHHQSLNKENLLFELFFLINFSHSLERGKDYKKASVGRELSREGESVSEDDMRGGRVSGAQWSEVGVNGDEMSGMR